MSSSWHEVHENLLRSSSTLHFQRGYTLIRSQYPPLGRFGDPTALYEYLHRGGDTPAQKNIIWVDLIRSSQAGGRAGDCALTLSLVSLWPGLDAVFRRSRGRRLGQVDELASEILARATAAVRHLDLAKVNWIAATILQNIERDVRRAHQRETHRQRQQDEFDPDTHGGTTDVADADTLPKGLLAELTGVIGSDARLVIRVVVDGYTQAEAGKQMGLSESVARKRFQRALKRLRDHAEQKS